MNGPAPHIKANPLLGFGMLLTAATVWGLAFVPQKWSVMALPPLQATALRFCIAAPLALLLARKQLRAPGVKISHGLLLGALLFVVYTLQTTALTYTSVARVSLLTGLYAVFVPLFAPLLGMPRPKPGHWLGVLLAFAGMFALTGAFSGDNAGAPPNLGDLLTVLHSVAAAFQVLLISRLAQRAQPLALNALQLSGVAVLGVVATLVVDGVPHLQWSGLPWGSFLYLSVLSTVFAFTLQILGQRHASAAMSAVVMLVETPVGVLGAVVFFHETMDVFQWMGAAVLFLGIAVSLVVELRTQRV